MKQFYQFITKQMVLQGLCLLIIGAAILYNPKAVFDIIVLIISIYLLVNGSLRIVEGLRLKKKDEAYYSPLTIGISSIIAAIIIFIFASQFIGLLTILLGGFIVFSAVLNLIQGIQLQKYSLKKAAGFIIYSTVLLIMGLILIFSPYDPSNQLFRFIGFIFVVMGIAAIVSSIIFPSEMKEPDEIKQAEEVHQNKDKKEIS